METSGDSALSIILALVILGLFAAVTARPVWGRALRQPWPAIATVLVIGIPSLLQFVWPQVGTALMRGPEDTLRHGEWWRVGTALLAQDGGIAAAVFSLVVVAIVVGISSAVWDWWRAVVVFVACSIVLNLAALAWQPGGGSSFASDGLLMATSAQLAITGGRGQRWAAGAQVAASAVLVAAGDAHGVAYLLGFALGAALTALGPPISRPLEARG